MIGFAAFRWDPTDRRSEHHAAELIAVLHGQGWREAINRPGWRVMCDPQAPILTVIAADPGVVVIGHLFERPAGDGGPVRATTTLNGANGFADLCSALVGEHWGAYIVLAAQTDNPAALTVLRDPLGLLDCSTWRSKGLRIVTSHARDILALARPDHLAIDWIRLGQIIRCPGSTGDALPFHGVEAILPATLTGFEPARHDAPLWSPARMARRPRLNNKTGRTDPVGLIDACILAWSERFGPGLAELSGGLDSAIVAAGLAQGQSPGAMHWLHFHADHAPSDERPSARAIAAHLGLSYTEVTRPESVIDAATIESIPLGMRPSVASLSLFHDQALAIHARETGANVLFTGQGGDALFYQLASPAIGDDIWRSDLPFAGKFAATRDLASWTATSVWTIAGAALRARFGAGPLPDPHFPLDLVDRSIPRRCPALAWLDDAGDLAPSRRVPVLQLAAMRAIMAPSWSNETMTVVHPLLSQPIVEHFLGLSAFDLTEARRDRALVRRAYAGRLPATLLERRGKGCVTAYYGRMIARSLPFLRAYLLDSILAAKGVFARDRLEAVLDEHFLMQTNAYAKIFCALFAERWARGWEAIIASG